MCKHGPRGMAVTYHQRKRVVPYRTRLTGRLMSTNEGFDANASDPSPFGTISNRARRRPNLDRRKLLGVPPMLAVLKTVHAELPLQSDDGALGRL